MAFSPNPLVPLGRLNPMTHSSLFVSVSLSLPGL